MDFALTKPPPPATSSDSSLRPEIRFPIIHQTRQQTNQKNGMFDPTHLRQHALVLFGFYMVDHQQNQQKTICWQVDTSNLKPQIIRLSMTFPLGAPFHSFVALFQRLDISLFQTCHWFWSLLVSPHFILFYLILLYRSVQYISCIYSSVLIIFWYVYIYIYWWIDTLIQSYIYIYIYIHNLHMIHIYIYTHYFVTFKCTIVIQRLESIIGCVFFSQAIKICFDIWSICTAAAAVHLTADNPFAMIVNLFGTIIKHQTATICRKPWTIGAETR